MRNEDDALSSGREEIDGSQYVSPDILKGVRLFYYCNTFSRLEDCSQGGNCDIVIG